MDWFLYDNGLRHERANKFSQKKAKQEILSRQQKSTKKGSEKYLIFKPNRILVTFEVG